MLCTTNVIFCRTSYSESFYTASCPESLYQEEGVGEDGEDLPPIVIHMACNAAMQCPAARSQGKIVAAA